MGKVQACSLIMIAHLSFSRKALEDQGNCLHRELSQSNLLSGSD